MSTDQPEPPRCAHIVGDGTKRRNCKVKPGSSGYCFRHERHQDRIVEAASVSLADYVADAIRALGRVVNEGEKDADVVKASVAILDRAGYGPSHTVKVDDIRREIEAELGDDDGTEPA